MNNWHTEFMAEYDRRRILQEVAQIRLEKFGIKSHIDRPRLFARTMVRLGNWMISTGRQLRQHYEIPVGARI